MNYQKFTNPDGSTLAWVNLDAVLTARPLDNGKVGLMSSLLSIEVDASQFEDALQKSRQEQKDRSVVLGRLTQAIDRLTVRFPSSIRLHI